MNALRRLTTNISKNSLVRFNFSDNFKNKERTEEKLFIDKEESRLFLK
jgi:hypothetical protein